jgi:hypothetical protein
VLPLHFADGFDQRGLGLLYMGMSVAVAFAAGAAARYAPRLMVVLSTVLVSVGLGLAAATPAPSYWIVALLVAGVGVGIGTTGSTGVLLETVPPERIVTAVIVWSQIGIAGYLVGPLVGGCRDPDPRLLGDGGDSARGRSGDRGNAGLASRSQPGRPASSAAVCRFRPSRAALTKALIPTPRITRSRSIWNVTTRRALWLVAEMSPNPTVEKIVTAR